MTTAERHILELMTKLPPTARARVMSTSLKREKLSADDADSLESGKQSVSSVSSADDHRTLTWPWARAELFDFAAFLLHKHSQVEQAVLALDILAEPLTETSFRTANQVRDYLDEERNAWER
ncbi:MAG: hypothetical protein H7Z42_20770 [Roseiflexaceae bacterium]|nr:hypothetical protein [Roseiflexaceae bacterium]